MLPPAPVPRADALVAAVNSEGKLLAFPVGEVPELPRGKGNKLFDIPGKKAASARGADDRGRGRAAQGEPASCTSGEQQMTLEWRDLKDYRGERAQRGAVLPRGWPRQIDRMEAQLPPSS